MVTPGTTGLTRDMDALLETMLDSSILMVIFLYLANEIVIFMFINLYIYIYLANEISTPKVAPNVRVGWMNVSTQKLFLSTQGSFFLPEHHHLLKVTFYHLGNSPPSNSSPVQSFSRTFPAAIAGRGDYFHYDIDTKEAVSL